MFKTSKEHVSPINNILYNGQVLWMLNVLHGTKHANKEPLESTMYVNLWHLQHEMNNHYINSSAV